MFGRRKGSENAIFDKENELAVIRYSICTGEKVAGFKDIHTGHFRDVCLIRTEADLIKFKRRYDVEEVTTEY